MRHAWQSSSPGKGIIFGEYAALWGQRALARPLPMRLTIRWKHESQGKSGVFFDHKELSWDVIESSAREVSARYAEHIRGHCPIEAVLSEHGLVSAALALAPQELRKGCLFLDIESELHSGSGQGSSAALITAVLKGLGIKDREQAWQLENYQHGHSSGLDIAVAWQECAMQRKSGKIVRAQPKCPDLLLIHTGTPQATTGQCVSYVEKTASSELKAQYPIEDIERAVSLGDEQSWHQALKKTHQWLCALGVVPAHVQEFIAEVESLGSAAKVSGAGSMCGDSAGLVIAQKRAEVSEVAKKYGYDVRIWEASQ